MKTPYREKSNEAMKDELQVSGAATAVYQFIKPYVQFGTANIYTVGGHLGPGSHALCLSDTRPGPGRPFWC
ncbi:hypothetical protein EVAR_64301_1 [Eumeta japonica]|uniref:Uncharacterized protein n=1 Tax=Eumeta variegata TaxID=151549 RepID=A0A4C1ZRZ4_EUMVA|nr:hypothetical protein EVAR_64301_1 [Eumeta japonica]